MTIGQHVFKIVNGPGEKVFSEALMNGGTVEFTIDGPGGGRRKCRARIGKTTKWDISGDEIELFPGQWIKLNNAQYSASGRTGQIVMEFGVELQESPICGCLIPKDSHYCPRCGRNQRCGE